ncbi:hypothetical protein MIT9_P2445 [Methylomarinovum caldicuralii]|uniref:Uncharacterized protein n=1 Tax=Methylomarinovum caldicuralii TaxID=438856 RepID=A0AAU9C6N4_9GAMM|nr:hypothetical protein [Methylomarinovum caldicuralii]BCX82854.1 hypothetical protein MIT9_P2445 [Methylomarinovum caldicuralii]
MNDTRFVLCIDNSAYPAALEKRKVYQVVPDPEAQRHHCLRVVDESGEDYLYPDPCFVAIELPEAAEAAFDEEAA